MTQKGTKQKEKEFVVVDAVLLEVLRDSSVWFNAK